MNKLKTLGCGLAALALGCGAAIAQDDISVSTTTLKGGLYLLQGRGGNVVASQGVDGLLIIDDDYPQYAAAYQKALDALAGDSATPRFVLNTHWHGDHTGGNNYWGEAGAVIVAHDNVLQRMSTRQEMKAFKRVVEPSPRAALPVVTFSDSLALHFNDDDIEMQHYASGHTDGDSVVYFSAANVVHMGDHFFKDRFPFVDTGSGGNVLSFTANIASILQRVDDNTLIVPGHGSLANRADLVRFHHMLVSTTSTIKDALAGGKAAADISLGEEWTSWGGGFINETTWISIIAASL